MVVSIVSVLCALAVATAAAVALCSRMRRPTLCDSCRKRLFDYGTAGFYCRKFGHLRADEKVLGPIGDPCPPCRFYEPDGD